MLGETPTALIFWTVNADTLIWAKFGPQNALLAPGSARCSARKGRNLTRGYEYNQIWGFKKISFAGQKPDSSVLTRRNLLGMPMGSWSSFGVNPA